jgi:MFS family permease
MIVGLAGYAISPTLSVAVAVMVVVGAAYIGTLTGLNSVVQLHAPGGERSRILSLYTMSLSVAYPLGAFTQSFFVHRFGLRPVTLISTGLMVCVYLAVRTTAPRFVSVMGDTPTPSE